MYQFVFFTDITDTIFVTKIIGAYKCAHMLRTNGYSCLVVDHFHTYSKEELDELLDKIITKETLGVGFSTTFLRNSNVPVNLDGSQSFSDLPNTTFFPQGKEVEDHVVTKIKQLNANCKISIGGTRAVAYSQNKNVDYILIGFSEGSIVNLANHLFNQTPLTNAVRNLWGITVIDDRRAESHDFKNTAFKWVDSDIINAKVLPIEIARGCVFKCKFCSYPMNGKQNLDFVKDIDVLREELQSNYDRYGIYTYSIVDDTFNDNDYKIDLILAAVQQLTFQPIFWAYIRLDLLHSKQHFDKLYAIGVRACYFGIETLNKKAGAIVGKGMIPEKQIQTLQELRNTYGNKIALHGSFIIGLPGETIENVTNTFNLVMDETIPLHTFDFKALFIERAGAVAWNSEFALNYEKYGYTKIDDEGSHINWQNDCMTRTQAFELENNFRTIAHASNRLHIAGQAMWSLMNYGYSIDYLLNLKHDNVPWHDLSIAKDQYIKQYKQELNKLLLDSDK